MMIFSQISQSSRGNYDDFSEISRSSGILFKKKLYYGATVVASCENM